MTIEQKAERYALLHYGDKDENGEWLQDDVIAERAYIAGATENGVVWHNIKENPDDLPKTPKEDDAWKLVLGNDGNQWFYNETKKEWYTRNSYDNDWGSGCKALIAWAEIPTFEV